MLESIVNSHGRHQQNKQQGGETIMKTSEYVEHKVQKLIHFQATFFFYI